MAQVYLRAHPELYVAALERARRMTAEGVFGKRAQRAYLNNSAQTTEPCLDKQIPVHNSGA
jgi:hypothetical protein